MYLATTNSAGASKSDSIVRWLYTKNGICNYQRIVVLGKMGNFVGKINGWQGKHYDVFNHPVILILGKKVINTSCSSWLLLKKTLLPALGEISREPLFW